MKNNNQTEILKSIDKSNHYESIDLILSDRGIIEKREEATNTMRKFIIELAYIGIGGIPILGGMVSNAVGVQQSRQYKVLEHKIQKFEEYLLELKRIMDSHTNITENEYAAIYISHKSMIEKICEDFCIMKPGMQQILAGYMCEEEKDDEVLNYIYNSSVFELNRLYSSKFEVAILYNQIVICPLEEFDPLIVESLAPLGINSMLKFTDLGEKIISCLGLVDDDLINKAKTMNLLYTKFNNTQVNIGYDDNQYILEEKYSQTLNNYNHNNLYFDNEYIKSLTIALESSEKLSVSNDYVIISYDQVGNHFYEQEHFLHNKITNYLLKGEFKLENQEIKMLSDILSGTMGADFTVSINLPDGVYDVDARLERQNGVLYNRDLCNTDFKYKKYFFFVADIYSVLQNMSN